MNAREVALNILNEVYTQQAYANIIPYHAICKKINYPTKTAVSSLN